eukprot:393392_1
MYRYLAPQSYNLKMIGTATVFATNPNNETVYAITCAHNIRQHILECIDCGRYMNVKNTTMCINTNCSNTNLKEKMIKATQVKFQRRSVKKKYYKGDDDDEKQEVIFGDVIKTYNNISCEFIYDSKFETYYKAPHGYDLAIISFIDATTFYSTFYQMWGMQSSGTDYWIKRNHTTNREYLKHQEIDTFGGQSGSAMWYIDESGNNIIFAIHAGGNQEKHFNVATLLSEQDIINIGSCCPALHDSLLEVMASTKLLSFEEVANTKIDDQKDEVEEEVKENRVYAKCIKKIDPKYRFFREICRALNGLEVGSKDQIRKTRRYVDNMLDGLYGKVQENVTLKNQVGDLKKRLRKTLRNLERKIINNDEYKKQIEKHLDDLDGLLDQNIDLTNLI